MILAGHFTIGLCAVLFLHTFHQIDSPPPPLPPPCICDSATSSAICAVAMSVRQSGCKGALQVVVNKLAFKNVDDVGKEEEAESFERTHRLSPPQMKKSTGATSSASASLNVDGGTATPAIDITVSGSGVIHISKEGYRALIAGLVTTSTLLTLAIAFELVKLVRGCIEKRRQERLERERRARLGLRRFHDCGRFHSINEPCDFTGVPSRRKDDRGGGGPGGRNCDRRRSDGADGNDGRGGRGGGCAGTAATGKRALEVPDEEETSAPLVDSEEIEIESGESEIGSDDDGQEIEASSGTEAEVETNLTSMNIIARAKQRMFGGEKLPAKPSKEAQMNERKRRTDDRNDTMFSEDESNRGAATNGVGTKKNGQTNGGDFVVSEREMTASVHAARKKSTTGSYSLSGAVEQFARDVVDNVDDRIRAVHDEHAAALRQLANPPPPLLDFDVSTNAAEIAAMSNALGGSTFETLC